MGEFHRETAASCPAVRPATAVALLAALVTLAAVPRPAAACLFYEGGDDDHRLVDETGLEVLLRQRGQQTTLVLGARTEGSVPDLGWIVAVPGFPEIDRDTTLSFVSLDSATAPIFRTGSPSGGSALAESGGAGCGSSAPASANEPPRDFAQLTILGAVDAGPYTVTTLTAGNVEELRTWATDNGYPWLSSAEPDFEHYIGLNWFFVAAKVRPDRTEPSLVPLIVSYPSDELVVPLMLSRRDAVVDMSVVVWVVADSAVAPRGWAQVALDTSKIVADEQGSNYANLVSQAVDGAGGRGFVTEYVQRTDETAFRINDEPTRLFLGTEGWVTRLYTRVDPDDLTDDPTFVLDDSIQPVEQIHDLTQVEGGPYWGGAVRPIAGFTPIGLVLLARLLRRRRAL